MIGDAPRTCCAIRKAIRKLRGELCELFTCDKCGRAYRKQGWSWREVSVLDEIADMMKEQEIQR